jgi:hypothetical protein
MTRSSVAEKSRPSIRLRYLPGAAEQGVDHREHQGRVADHESRAAQRLDAHDVEVRRHDDLAQELAELLHPHAVDQHLGGRGASGRTGRPGTLRANRSLMISIVGMRPRTMRSWLARL